MIKIIFWMSLESATVASVQNCCAEANSFSARKSYRGKRGAFPPLTHWLLCRPGTTVRRWIFLPHHRYPLRISGHIRGRIATKVQWKEAPTLWQIGLCNKILRRQGNIYAKLTAKLGNFSCFSTHVKVEMKFQPINSNSQPQKLMSNKLKLPATFNNHVCLQQL